MGDEVAGSGESGREAGIENLPVHPTLNKSFKYVAPSCAMELTSGW